MRAAELFVEATRLAPMDQARYVSAGLDRLFAGGPISFWSPEESIPMEGRWILVGFAPYSLPELELLDKIKEALERSLTRREKVQIFNVLDCKTMADLEKYIPGIGNVCHTPVVGIWQNGVLIQKASGAEGRRLILERSINV
jgi:hypothetical protein